MNMKIGQRQLLVSRLTTPRVDKRETNIKEPECLAKWQLLRLNTLIQQHERLQQVYDRLAPMQEKLFNYMEREIDEQEDTESWKRSLDEDDEDES